MPNTPPKQQLAKHPDPYTQGLYKARRKAATNADTPGWKGSHGWAALEAIEEELAKIDPDGDWRYETRSPDTGWKWQVIRPAPTHEAQEATTMPEQYPNPPSISPEELAHQEAAAAEEGDQPDDVVDGEPDWPSSYPEPDPADDLPPSSDTRHREAFSTQLAKVTAKPLSKAEQARQLTGDQLGSTLEPPRAGLLIAKVNLTRNNDGSRVYWPKSTWPTLEAAQAALHQSGLDTGLAFTQYRAAGPFKNLVELIAQRTTPSHQAGATHEAEEATTMTESTTTPTAEQVSAPTEEQAKTARKRQASKAKATPKAKASTPKGSWASRNPQLVATIPQRIKEGQHPKAAAEEWGVSIEITWRLFKQAGWVASGKGGGKAFTFASAADRKKAQAAVKALSEMASTAGVSVARVIRQVEEEAKAQA